MRRRQIDLILVVVLACIDVLFVLLPTSVLFLVLPTSIWIRNVRIILALPLVFLLPGYALTEALFCGPSSDNMHRYRFVLSLGFSLALDVISGLALNLFPIGLQTMPWAVCLGTLTLVFSLLAVFRRIRLSNSGTGEPLFRIFLRREILLGVSLIVAIAIIVFSIQFSTTSAKQQPSPGFTQLWMLPPNQATTTCEVNLGIQNFETTSVTYKLSLIVNGTQIQNWPSIVLVPQQQWKRLVPIPVAKTDSTFVKVLLYRLDRPDVVYREVHLTLHSLAGNQAKQAQQCTT